MNTDPHSPFVPTTPEQAETIAKWIADSHCFGVKTPAQALTVMLIAASEGQSIANALKRYHIFDDGKLSQRADYTQAAFEQHGSILWHIRSDDMVAATFFNTKEITDDARNRAIRRFELQWRLDAYMAFEKREMKEESKLISELNKLAHEGEATVIRTLADAQAKGVTEGSKGTKQNWLTSPRAMLTWRCVTEGVRVCMPGIVAGLPMDVDLQDSRTGTSAPTDRESMTEIIEEYRAQAEMAEGIEKQRLLGLASEMRCKIADMDVEKTTVLRAQNGQMVVDVCDGPPSPPKSFTDYRETIAPQSTVIPEAITTAVQNLSANPATKSMIFGNPASVVSEADAEAARKRWDEPEPAAPKRKRRTATELPATAPEPQSAVPAQDLPFEPVDAEQTSAASLPGPDDEPFAADWQSYIIQSVKNARYKGRTLQSMSNEEIDALQAHFAAKVASSPAAVEDAKMVAEAWQLAGQGFHAQ